MYDVIENLINHNWITQGASEQQYIYYISGTVIVILTVYVLDLIKSIIRSAAGKR